VRGGSGFDAVLCLCNFRTSQFCEVFILESGPMPTVVASKHQTLLYCHVKTDFSVSVFLTTYLPMDGASIILLCLGYKSYCLSRMCSITPLNKVYFIRVC
jgi:hypothetical protein